MKGLPIETQLKLATYCRSLIENDCFIDVIERLQDRYMTELLGSKPLQPEIREDCYQRIRVLQDVQAHMVGLTIAGEQELARQMAENEDS